MENKVVIFGTGDIAQIANYYFEIDSDYEVVAFTVNRSFKTGDNFLEKPLIAFEEIEKKYPTSEYKMFIALSYTNLNSIRANKYHEAKKKGYKLVSYISSKCTYMSQYTCGDNCFIFEDNTIQPFVKLGNNITLWSGNHIGHHSEIKDHNFISSHVVVSGHCYIDSYCFIGVNATLHNDVKLAAKNIIAAGAIIAQSTEEQSIWVPSRSKLLDKKSSEVNL